MERDPIRSDFLGKKIIDWDFGASNVWRFFFDDGTAIAIEADVFSTQYGGIPVMQVCVECAIVDVLDDTVETIEPVLLSEAA